MLRISPDISIDESELQETFIRASGPGGQHVNKVSTAVQLRFDAKGSPALTPDILQRLKRLAGSRWTEDGSVVITARRYRSRERNREDARQRLAELIRRATVPPVSRRPTKPSSAARQRRLDAKKRRSSLKNSRQKPRFSDS